MRNKNIVTIGTAAALSVAFFLSSAQVQARVDVNGFAADRGAVSSMEAPAPLSPFTRAERRWTSALPVRPMPARPLLRAPAVTPDSYNVFRSVVVPVGQLKAFEQWENFAPKATSGEATICTGALCKSVAGKRMAAAAKKAAGLSQLEAMRLINLEVNKAIRYKSDRGDDWASLEQSALRGTGDCEDYAIAKMTLLNRIGFAPEQLQFIVLKDTRRQLYHAVLAVHVDGERYILDNMSNVVANDTLFRSYAPIASFVGNKSFIHGFTSKSSSVATLGPGGLAAIQLGEGR